MATSPVDFKVRFPEFDSISDARVQLFLDDAAALMADEGKWLSFYDIAHAYFGAHLLYISEGSSTGDGGINVPIKKQQVDDVLFEGAVANIESTLNELYTTVYGKHYLDYRKIVTVGIYGV